MWVQVQVNPLGRKKNKSITGMTSFYYHSLKFRVLPNNGNLAFKIKVI